MRLWWRSCIEKEGVQAGEWSVGNGTFGQSYSIHGVLVHSIVGLEAVNFNFKNLVGVRLPFAPYSLRSGGKTTRYQEGARGCW